MKWCLVFKIAVTNGYVYVFEFEKNSKKEAVSFSDEIIQKAIKPVAESNKSSYNSLFLVEKKEFNSFLQQNF